MAGALGAQAPASRIQSWLRRPEALSLPPLVSLLLLLLLLPKCDGVRAVVPVGQH